MSDENEIRGYLFQLGMVESVPVMRPLALRGTPRKMAMLIARREMFRSDWGGPRQVVFLHESGEAELWTPATLTA